MSPIPTKPLGKLVAHRAGMSRRVAGQAVRRGRVVVEGTVCTDPRERIATASSVVLDGVPLSELPALAVWHKPVGVHCTMRDGRGRPCLETHAEELLDRKLHPVGRLDADTSGLLLFAAEGRLTQRLLHPKHAVPRSYVAEVDPEPGTSLVKQLEAGVSTAMGVFTAEDVQLDGRIVSLTVREGKHRMVRRMLANAGHPVLHLRRIAFGPFTLGPLEPEDWRKPNDAEQAWLDALFI